MPNRQQDEGEFATLDIYWMHCTELGNVHFQNILNLSDANIGAKKNATSNKDTHKTAFSIML